MWTSTDRGASWKLARQMTTGSSYNHTYVRRPINAHDGFYAFWADGDPSKLSDSHLYFTDREGSHVWKLPEEMTEEFAKPKIIEPAQ